MGQVEVRSHQIWGAHVHGADFLRYRIFKMEAGELIRLEVGGYSGVWKKMANNRTTGEPTQGLKPLGKARRYWRHLLENRSLDLVSIGPAPSQT